MRQITGRWHPPPPIFLEGRVSFEYLALMRDPIYAGKGAPVGRGRAVMLIPGFLAGDRSLDPMRNWLQRAGFRPLRSGIDLNAQASVVLVERIAARLRQELKPGEKAIVIGQSRGGNLGLMVAQLYPELVETLITLGSPIGGPYDVHPSVMMSVHAVRILHALRNGPKDIDAEIDRKAREKAKVPVYSFYSRSDGIVHWEACLRPDVTGIEVSGTHIGMGVNRMVYRELAKLLA